MKKDEEDQDIRVGNPKLLDKSMYQDPRERILFCCWDNWIKSIGLYRIYDLQKNSSYIAMTNN